MTTDGSRRLTKGNKNTNFFVFFFLTKSLISQFWRRKKGYRERRSKKLVETHKQKPSVNHNYLPKKEAWDLPKKGVTQGFVRWLSMTGLARIKRWAIRSYNSHHRTISTLFFPTTTIAEAEMRAAYLHPTTRRPKRSVRWGRLFCSLGTDVIFIGNSYSVRCTHILFIWNSCYFRWERTLCSLKTHVLSVGNACFLVIGNSCSVRWERMVLFVGDTPWTNSPPPHHKRWIVHRWMRNTFSLVSRSQMDGWKVDKTYFLIAFSFTVVLALFLK